MFSVPLKLTEVVDLKSPLNRGVAEYYSKDTSKLLKHQISTIDMLRTKMTASRSGSAPTYTDFANYYHILQSMYQTLDGSNSLLDVIDSQRIQVVWAELFNPNSKQTLQFNAKQEMYFALHNMAAIKSVPGTFNMSRAADLTEMATKFCEAAGIYKLLHDKDCGVLSDDLSTEIVAMFYDFCLAEAHACTFYKAVLTKKHTICAGLAATSADYFDRTLRMIKSQNIGPKTWRLLSIFTTPEHPLREYCEYQLAAFRAASSYYASIRLIEDFEAHVENYEVTTIYGIQLAWLHHARSHIQKLQDLPSKNIPPQVQEKVKELGDSIAGTILDCEEDNDNMYQQSVPGFNSLEEVQPIEHCKHVEFEEKNDDIEKLFNNMKSQLSYAKDCQVYKTKLATFVHQTQQKCSEEIQECNNLAVPIQRFPEARNPRIEVPDELWTIVEAIQKKGGSQHIGGMLDLAKKKAIEVEENWNNLRENLSTKFHNIDNTKYYGRLDTIQKLLDRTDSRLKKCEADIQQETEAFRRFSLSRNQFAGTLPIVDSNSVTVHKNTVAEIWGKVKDYESAETELLQSLNTKMAAQNFIELFKDAKKEDISQIFENLKEQEYAPICKKLHETIERCKYELLKIPRHHQQIEYEYYGCSGVVDPDTLKKLILEANKVLGSVKEAFQLSMSFDEILVLHINSIVKEVTAEENDRVDLNKSFQASSAEREKERLEAELREQRMEKQKRLEKQMKKKEIKRKDAERKRRLEEKERKRQKEEEERKRQKEEERKRQKEERKRLKDLQQRKQQEEIERRRKEEASKKLREVEEKRRREEFEERRIAAEMQAKMRLKEDEERKAQEKRRLAEEAERKMRKEAREQERMEEEKERPLQKASEKKMSEKEKKRRLEFRRLLEKQVESTEQQYKKKQERRATQMTDEKPNDKANVNASESNEKLEQMKKLLAMTANPKFKTIPQSQKRRMAASGSSDPSSSSSAPSSRQNAQSRPKRKHEEVDEHKHDNDNDKPACLCQENFQCAKCLEAGVYKSPEKKRRKELN